MQTEEMILASEFCIYHNIELSFIYSLKESGLIEISSTDTNLLLPVSQLGQLEKLVRLYYELDINLAGIETISYLLQRMTEMQEQIVQLNNQLQNYEHQ